MPSQALDKRKQKEIYLQCTRQATKNITQKRYFPIARTCLKMLSAKYTIN